MTIRNIHTQKGFLIIETLIAIVIFSLVAFSLFSTISFLQIRTQKSRYDAEASLLLQEGTEITHTIVFSNWEGYLDGVYFPAFDADDESWVLLEGEESGIKTRFTRNIRLVSVCRDTITGLQIADYEQSGVCSGEIDANSKIIVTTVDWREDDKDKSVTARLLAYKVPDS